GILDGVFASTIQADFPGSDEVDLDEATIERSIAEINEAIRKSATRKA
ncbi:MAG: serine/threonine-protein phosphatase, partial [Polaromonas sp.]|nr:serine/threonine-protein phosphatase [Polaromonas sp.]